MQILKKRADFVRLNQLRQSWVTPGFIILVARTDNKAVQYIDRFFRVGFTASKKVGNAVKRNFAKRRMRALAYQVMKTLGIKDHDYVIIARTAIFDISFDELKKNLEKAIKLIHKKHEIK